ncbi:YeiH family putative sulfate export transporter [Enterobacteriaceae bacterium LUAb1]
MTSVPLKEAHRRPGHYLPGLLLAGVITAVSIWLGNLPAVAGLGLGALTLAILIGILVGNSVYLRYAHVCDGGVIFSKQKLLRLGIILYGFRVTFQQIADVGLSGLIIDTLTLCSTFYLACWLGKHLFNLDRQTSWLIGAGSSICGAAAVLATEPVIRAEPSKVSVAVATVVLYGTISIFIYPLFWPMVQDTFSWITATQFGIYIGSTVHEVAQVVAAGQAINPEAESAAVISKMLRVMMLAPFLLFIGSCVRRQQTATGQHHGGSSFPWFALLFILVALFNSFHLLPVKLVDVIVQADTVLLAMAMAALGLTTHASAMKKAGMKPLLMALMLFIWLILGGGAINLLVHHFIS